LKRINTIYTSGFISSFSSSFGTFFYKIRDKPEINKIVKIPSSSDSKFNEVLSLENNCCPLQRSQKKTMFGNFYIFK